MMDGGLRVWPVDVGEQRHRALGVWTAMMAMAHGPNRRMVEQAFLNAGYGLRAWLRADKVEDEPGRQDAVRVMQRALDTATRILMGSDDLRLFL